MSQVRTRWIVAGLLATHVALLAYLAVRYSPTIDEVGHLPAGLYTWEFGRFDVYRVNPPLVRTLAAFPVWLSGPEYDWSSYRGELTARPEWSLGGDLMRANGEVSLWYFTWARWMLIPVSLLGGVICFRWARELYGSAAGLIALTLWCFSPSVLAYGALITPDLSAAAFGVTAAYAYWRWLRHPSAGWTLIGGLTLGLAELAKMTWIILFGLWPVLWVVWIVAEGRKPKVENSEAATFNPRVSPLNQLSKLTAILVLGLYVLNVGYAFDGSFQRLGEFEFVSHTLSGLGIDDGQAETGGNRFVGTWLEDVPIPLPQDYVTGIDLQKKDIEEGKWSFLRGEWKYGGWWYYYLYTVAVKEPLGTWCLLGIALIAAWKVSSANGTLRDTLVLLLPGLVLFAFVSSQTGFNKYIRYVLPAFPFAFVWASQAVRLVEQASRWWLVPVSGAVLWSVGSSLWIYPHSLSYFNEAVGGPSHGHEHLTDANVDWGQSLYDLRDWLHEHPEAAPVGVACQAYIPLEVLELTFSQVPMEPQPGWFIVSRHSLHHHSGSYDYFQKLEPVDKIAEALDVYHITVEDVFRLRGEFQQIEREHIE